MNVVAFGCGLCRRVWRWQLDVIRYSRILRDGRWTWLVHPRVWRWQLEVVGVTVFAGASWMWLVPAFVAVAVWVWFGHTRVAVAVGCGCRPRVWR